MRVFTRIVERQGFARAAQDLQLSPAMVSTQLKQLEAYLGVQLLRRTTRHVSPTADGQAYYAQCVRLLADLDDTEARFRETPGSPRGTLRLDLPSGIAQRLVMPALPAFCARYPQLELEISINDRPIDLLRDGIDCALRAGDIRDEGLVARPLAPLPQVTCASPAYLQRLGVPERLEALSGHHAVTFFSGASGQRFDLEFVVDGALRRLQLPGPLAVSGAGAYIAACEAGLGLIQAPYYHVRQQLAEGSLVELLPQWRPPALPLHAVYPPQRQLSRRLRVFVEWAQALFDDAPRPA